MKNLLIKAIPHAVAIVLFAILSAMYFSPILDGYNLRQGDINQHKGMSKEISDYRLLNGSEPLWTDSMFGGMPAYQISVVHSNNLLLKVDQIIKLGLPGPIGILFMSMLGFYIFALCLRINPWLGIIGGIAFGFATINILYLGAGHVSKVNTIAYMAPALGGLILTLRGRLILGTAVFALFFGLNVSANHLQITYYLAIMMAAVGLAEGIRLIIEKQFVYLAKAAGLLVLGLLLAVLPSMSNLMTTYEYSKFTTRGGSELTINPDGTPIDASESKGLNTDYILDYNFGSGEQWSLIIPNAKGGESGAIGNNKELMTSVPKQFKEQIGGSNQYWGEQRYTGGAFYFGAAIMFLFVLGLIFLKDTLKWPFLLLTIIALALCTNNPGGLNGFFIEKFPMYSKFRDSKMILTMIQVMAPAIALLFMDKVIQGEGLWGVKKHWLIGTGALILVGIVLAVSPTITGPLMSSSELAQFAEIENDSRVPAEQLAAYDEFKTSLMDVRASIYKTDATRSLMIFFAVAAIVVIGFFKKVPGIALIGVLAIVVAADQMTVCQRYLNQDQVKGQYLSYVKPGEGIVPRPADVADKAIFETEKINVAEFDAKKAKLLAAMKTSHLYENAKSKEQMDQVASFGTLNLNTQYRVATLGDPFNDAITSYYHKSIGGYHGAKLKRYQDLISFHLGKELQFIQDTLKSFADVTQLANVPALNMLNTKYLIYNPAAEPIPNPYACGPAWFVSEIQQVNSADEEITAINGLDPKKKAIVSKEFAFVKNAGGIDSTATVSLTEYATNRLVYQTKNSVDAPVIFSEIYYPAGWKVTIDGQPAEAFRANYILRGVMVPAGEHKIEWNFEPETFTKGSSYAMMGSIGLLVLVLASLAISFKQKK
ncbi:MAG: YfhO family protein [Flavobacteriales bacterium]